MAYGPRALVGDFDEPVVTRVTIDTVDTPLCTYDADRIFFGIMRPSSFAAVPFTINITPLTTIADGWTIPTDGLKMPFYEWGPMVLQAWHAIASGGTTDMLIITQRYRPRKNYSESIQWQQSQKPLLSPLAQQLYQSLTRTLNGNHSLLET